jgi:dihydrolipoamide dehydrogenase
MQEFDLVVIGNGSGLDVASAAAEHGWKVAIIEKDRMGSTCLNRGPKLLIHSADVAEVIRELQSSLALRLQLVFYWF